MDVQEQSSKRGARVRGHSLKGGVMVRIRPLRRRDQNFTAAPARTVFNLPCGH